jgi:hypothetical protein
MKKVLSRIERRWAAFLQDLVRRTVLPVFRRHLDSQIRRDWRAAVDTAGNPLLRHGAKYFSQFDEDGILLEILRRLDLARGRFVEVGVGDGTENNTIVLLAHGWSGLWLGNEPLVWAPSGARLEFQRVMVTPETVGDLVGPQPIDVFSLDIDGNDYWILQAVLARTTPRVVIVEYNAKFPPPVRFVMPADVTHRWNGTDYFGASFQAWVDLMTTAGYRPVCCNYTGLNLFFVRAEDGHRFTDVPADSATLYRPPLYLPPFTAGHPVSPETVAALERGTSAVGPA